MYKIIPLHSRTDDRQGGVAKLVHQIYVRECDFLTIFEGCVQSFSYSFG